jgi:hypothetical protein
LPVFGQPDAADQVFGVQQWVAITQLTGRQYLNIDAEGACHRRPAAQLLKPLVVGSNSD